MKQKTRILIYILIGAAIVIAGTVIMFAKADADKKPDVGRHIDLGRKYLIELSYDKAVLEFTEAIKIEPQNPDAYKGLALTYEAMGDTEQALAWLQKGYDLTGDSSLQAEMDRINAYIQPAETSLTTVTTAVTTEITTTVTTEKMLTVPDLIGMSESDAVSACEAAEIPYSILTEESDSVEKGFVVSQRIPASAKVKEGVELVFVVSEGRKVVTTAATTVTTTAAATAAATTDVAVTTAAKTTTSEATAAYTPRIDPNYMFITPDVEQVEFMSGNFEKKWTTQSKDFAPKKSGYYGFYYVTANNKSHPMLYANTKSPYFSCGISNNGTYYLHDDKEYSFYIKEKGPFSIDEIDFPYSVTMYLPNDSFNIEGSFTGNLFFQGQFQKYYFTSPVTGEYNFTFDCSDGVNYEFKCGEKDSDNTNHSLNINGYKEYNIKLKAGVTYKFTIRSNNTTQGNYKVIIS